MKLMSAQRARALAFRQRANVAQAFGHDAAGFVENSPAIYGWVKCHQHNIKVPSGTAEQILSSLTGLGNFRTVNPAINGWAIVKDRPIADDEAASGTPEHSLSGNAQTSRRRLAMTHRHGRNINANPLLTIMCPKGIIAKIIIQYESLYITCNARRNRYGWREPANTSYWRRKSHWFG